VSKLDDRAAQQKMIALANPCELATQCNNTRYFFDIRPRQDLFARAGLTVNVGEE